MPRTEDFQGQNTPFWCKHGEHCTSTGRPITILTPKDIWLLCKS